MQDFNDQKNLDKIINGDTRIFETLVNQYKNMVFTLALQLIKNKEEAEEVAQDTFIKVYKNLHKFKGESKFSSWLYRITYNTCLDNLRKNKKNNETYDLDDITINKIKTIDNALDELERQEKKEMIKKCLSKLKEEEQVLLTLYYYEELSLQEIASVLNKKYDQIRVNLHRSRIKLAKILENNLTPEILENYGRK